MNVVPNLLTLVSKDTVFPPLKVALNQIAEKAVQFDTGVIRSGETPAPQTTGGHPKVATIFLNHDICRNL